MFEFAQRHDVLQPAEALPDPLSLLLTEVVTGMPRGARIDRTAARPGCVLRNVRGHVHVATFVDKLRSVISLVAADRDATFARNLFQHQNRRIAFGPPRDEAEKETVNKPQRVLIGFRAVYVFERLSRDLWPRLHALDGNHGSMLRAYLR